MRNRVLPPPPANDQERRWKIVKYVGAGVTLAIVCFLAGFAVFKAVDAQESKQKNGIEMLTVTIIILNHIFR